MKQMFRKSAITLKKHKRFFAASTLAALLCLSGVAEVSAQPPVGEKILTENLFLVKDTDGRVDLGLAVERKYAGQTSPTLSWVNLGSQNGSYRYSAGTPEERRRWGSSATYRLIDPPRPVATGQPAELKSAQLRRQVDSLKIGHSKLAQDSVFYEPKSKMMSRVIAVFEDGTIAYYHASAHPVQYVHSSQILLDPPASDRNPPPAPPPYRLPDLKISKKGSSPNLNSQTGKSGSAK